MDLNKLRALGNNFRDVRLISLRDWKSASEVEPRDHGGPYVVVQEGYAPHDLTMSFDEFLLGRSGQWVTVGVFLKLPKDIRRQEFVFGTAAEVMALLGSIGGTVRVFNRVPEQASQTGDDDNDDLPGAIHQARQNPETVLQPREGGS